VLRLFNTLGKRIETFHPVNKNVVTIFTCGPSVYQRAHVGNFRTFLFEDILARYLKYSGYTVRRGMNLTDIEDKAIKEAEKKKTTLKRLTEKNIKEFIQEIKLLRMKIPDYLPKSSESIDDAAEIIEQLLINKIAYWYKGNIYFDPLKFPGFGKLYGLDMSKWPVKKKRFHKDTYPGMQWNLGDFILWHGYREGDRYYWDTRIGKGRPSWNIQDPSIISKHFHETLSMYCGGVDNLFRHHDYTLAILESVRPYPMARLWLHCHHLYVNGQKMSKSKGNIIYTEDLRKLGFTFSEIRFFLIYGHYRDRINYSDGHMRIAVDKLRTFKRLVKKINEKTQGIMPPHRPLVKWGWGDYRLKRAFSENMDNDLDVRGAFDGLYKILSALKIEELHPKEALGITRILREIDEVFKVIF